MATENTFDSISLEENSSSCAPMLDVDDVTQLEHNIAASGTTMSELMNNAGRAVAKEVMEIKPAPARICVIVGAGNNGGDGWVCARELLRQGYSIDVEALKPPAAINAQPAHEIALETVRECQSNAAFHVDVAPDENTLHERLSSADICVDALLGTGFSGLEVRKPLNMWVDEINKAHEDGCTVVAVDVPSGLNAHNGMPAKPCVSADVTVTMMVKKSGLEVKFGLAKCGKLFVANIIDLTPYQKFLDIVRVDY